MGVQCTVCQDAYLITDSKQLQSMFLADKKAGSYLNLSIQQKKTYWQKIKGNQFRLQSQNKLAPNKQENKIMLYFPYKYLYQGSIQDNIPHGEGRLNIITQNAIVEGTFDKGKLNGQCRISFKNQKQIRGSWSQGTPIQLQWRKQKGKYEIKFEDQKLNKGTVKFPNKSQYIGQFHFNFQQKMLIIVGKGTLKYQNGQILQGQFKNGYLQGKGIYKSSKEKYTYTGDFKRGLFNGQGTCDFEDRGILRIGWKDNKPQGQGEFQINGACINVVYEKGVRIQAKMSNFYS